jgi:hypothetical protein
MPDVNLVGEDSCDLLSNEARLNLSVKFVCKYKLESLILAQDERWRRA